MSKYILVEGNPSKTGLPGVWMKCYDMEVEIVVFLTYPWIIESDPVFHAVAKLFKAQVGIFIEMIHDASVLPSTIFFLQDLDMKRIKHSANKNHATNRDGDYRFRFRIGY